MDGCRHRCRQSAGQICYPVIIGTGVQFPALVDDIFVARAASADDAAIKEVISQVEDAIRVHTEARQKEFALSLPPGCQHLASNVLRFHESGSYDQSVFVMMKFPDPTAIEPKQRELLENIWDVVVKTLASYGLAARKADRREYHDQLWENICVYMLGSRYGIAVLEDRVADELNPNVALEYGFMKSLNRQVALFRDVQFRHDRADLTGKLSKPFEIDSGGKLKPETLAKAVQDWLLNIGVSPIRRA
jgi:hypothetical protein